MFQLLTSRQDPLRAGAHNEGPSARDPAESAGVWIRVDRDPALGRHAYCVTCSERDAAAASSGTPRC